MQKSDADGIRFVHECRVVKQFTLAVALLVLWQLDSCLALLHNSPVHGTVPHDKYPTWFVLQKCAILKYKYQYICSQVYGIHICQ